MGFGILMKKLCWMWGSCEKGAGMQYQDPPTPCKQKQRVLLWSKQLHMLLKEVLISLLNVVENCGNSQGAIVVWVKCKFTITTEKFTREPISLYAV